LEEEGEDLENPREIVGLVTDFTEEEVHAQQG
jgi:hypothetical protein